MMVEHTFVIKTTDVDLLESPDGIMRDSVLVSAANGARDLSAGIVWVAPQSTIHEDTHDFDEVYYVIRGQANVVADGVPHAMSAGDAVLIPSGVSHRVENPNDSVFEIFWCIAAGWEALQAIQEELGKWPIVDASSGWHTA
jgi:mannose-6-phosphate isomerase-like protein (cupin superfamily)